MFGEASEEKEVAQIAGKTKEARSHKSFDTLHLVSRYASQKSVCDILIPIKDVSLKNPLTQQLFNLFCSNSGAGLVPQLQDSEEVKLVPPADCPRAV
jgi:hypothetical protein